MSLFEFGSGIDPGKLRLYIDVFIGSILCIWAGWVIWKNFELLAKEQLTIGGFIFNCAKVTTLLTLTLVVLIAY